MSIAHGKEQKMNKLATVSSTKTIVDKYGFRLTKSLGQNFLVDNNILESIIDSADLTGDDVVFEIGTGVGTLTRELSRHAKKVIAIEIDKKLIDLFEQRLDIVTNIDKVKKNNDIPIVNELREAEVVNQAIFNLNNKAYSDEITEYMKAIIAISRRLQLKSKDTGN